MSVDFARLRLKYHGDPEKMDDILQAECREKTARKLPGLTGNPGFRFPSLAVAEMSTSEAVADFHATLVNPGSSILDMTAGLGVDAYAMAARGCHVTACEIDPVTATTLRHNVRTLGLENDIEINECDSVRWLKENSVRFDVIFIDPARRDNAGRHFTLKECHPDVTSIMELLKGRCHTLIIKASPMMNPAELRDYGAETIVIGTVRECKEVVYVISPDGRPGRVRCVTLGHGEYQVSPEGEQQYGNPSPGDILLQPYPSVMKGGASATITGVTKLHPFSHLFFSHTPCDDFPGEAYLIESVMPFDRRTVKAFAATYPKINVAVRNFPLSAPELVRRLKIKEGGDMMLFGTTAPDGKRLLITARPIA